MGLGHVSWGRACPSSPGKAGPVRAPMRRPSVHAARAAPPCTSTPQPRSLRTPTRGCTAAPTHGRPCPAPRPPTHVWRTAAPTGVPAPAPLRPPHPPARCRGPARLSLPPCCPATHLPCAQGQPATRDGDRLAVAQHHGQQVGVRVLGLLRRPANTRHAAPACGGLLAATSTHRPGDGLRSGPPPPPGASSCASLRLPPGLPPTLPPRRRSPGLPAAGPVGGGLPVLQVVVQVRLARRGQPAQKLQAGKTAAGDGRGRPSSSPAAAEGTGGSGG
jgi:hypothetical protein